MSARHPRPVIPRHEPTETDVGRLWSQALHLAETLRLEADPLAAAVNVVCDMPRGALDWRELVAVRICYRGLAPPEAERAAFAELLHFQWSTLRPGLASARGHRGPFTDEDLAAAGIDVERYRAFEEAHGAPRRRPRPAPGMPATGSGRPAGRRSGATAAETQAAA